MGAISRKKALSLFCRFELPHVLLASSCGLMGVLGPIVEPFVLPMLDPWEDLAFGRTIPSEFIGNNHSRHILESFKELAKESLGSLFVASTLHQDIQHVPL